MWKYACRCYIFHLINCSQNVGTLWPEFVFFHFFHGPCVKKIININNKTKKNFGWFFNPHVHPSNTITKQLSWKTKTQNVTKTNIKIFKFAKFSNFKMKMRLQIKNFHVNYINSILMFVSNIKIPHAHC